MSLIPALRTRSILITCGTGGVGKTTLSAAMGVRAALEGRRVLVVTLDPAKRLATSLGIENLGNEPHELTSHLALPPGSPGTMWALMPDTRKTFEDFVRTLSPDPIRADRVLKNPIFQIFAKEFSGTNEYMALERLHALRKDPRFDLIILDTPPSRNTLDFLDAPRLLARFFEERLIKLLVMPANRLFAAGMKKALGLLEGLTGAGFMSHLLEFATALFEVQGRFTKNLSAIEELLHSQGLGFVLVTTPGPDTGSDVKHFVERVNSHGFQFDGLVLNRCLSHITGEPHATGEAGALLAALQERERDSIRQLETAFNPPVPIRARLPELARDIHNLEDLTHVAKALDHQHLA